jgi:hypothetical protein
MAISTDTRVMELHELHALPKPKALLTRISSRLSRVRNEDDLSQNEPDVNETLPSPTIAAVEPQERWNSSRTMIYRTFAAFWGFVIMGANDAAVGVSAYMRHRSAIHADNTHRP